MIFHSLRSFAETSLTTGTYGPAAFAGFTLTDTGNGNNLGAATTTITGGGDDAAIPGAFEGQNFFGWGNVSGGVIGGVMLTFDIPPRPLPLTGSTPM